MKTNWRRLGDILADVTSSREKLAAAANDVRAQPEEDGDPLPRGGVPDNGSPTRADLGEGDARMRNRTRINDGWVTRPPGKRRDANAPAKLEVTAEQSVKEPSPSPKARPVLPVGVDGKRGPAHSSPKGRSPSACAGPRLLSFDGGHWPTAWKSAWMAQSASASEHTNERVKSVRITNQTLIAMAASEKAAIP